MSDWIEHKGDQPPVGYTKLVDVRLSNGVELTGRQAKSVDWGVYGLGTDIVSYRIHKTPAPGCKQERYVDLSGKKDHIDDCADRYTLEEFRGAMKFNVEKYLKRLGKKDPILQELTKARDYLDRWIEAELNGKVQ